MPRDPTHPTHPTHPTRTNLSNAPELERIGTPAMVVSHYRSGTHLVMDLLRRQFPAFRPRMRPLESIHASYLSIDRFNTDSHRPIGRPEALRLLRKAKRATLKTHALPGFPLFREDVAGFGRALVARSAALYAVRDGRDVMCSMHAWRKSFDPTTPEDFADFVFTPNPETGKPAAREWAEHVLAWLDTEGVTPVRFERVVKDTRAVIDELATLLGETPVLREPLLPVPIKSVRASWLARLVGNVESTNVHSGGIRPLKRREAFDDAMTERFFGEAGEAMERLGYAR